MKMFRFSETRLLAILILFFPVSVLGQDSITVVSHAKVIVADCMKGDFEGATSYFDQELLYRMDAAKLSQTWKLIEGQIGKVIPGQEPVIQVEKFDSLMQVFHSCNFEKKSMDIKLVFNKNDKVIGFFFVPPNAKFSYQPPIWVTAGKVKEKDIDIQSADLRLKGKLTMPTEGTNFPVVVLVHGSGPQDMDMTIGPNCVFKDIAMSLAAHGIAVIRFDKRTKAYRAELTTMIPYMTPDEETVQDAVAAVTFAEGEELLDHRKIIVLGHSFGGMMAPQIASKSKSVRGVILMAANARPIQQLIIDQLKYISKSDSANPDIQKSLALMQEKVDRVNSKNYADDTELSLLPMGIGPPYWKYLENYDQFKVAEQLKIPMLVLQGERDYQVTMDDFKIWQEKLKSRPQTTFKSFPEMNHLFMSGEGPSMPVEYDKKSNLDKSVTDFIADWIWHIGL